MDKKQLKELIRLHGLWLRGDSGGVKADLSEADLRWAGLRWADLRWAGLSGANLRGANLRGADLSKAGLRWADLRWANLSGANLSGADLSGANLSGADLSKAGLRWANLRGADLSGADLSEADLSEANLRGADLRGAKLPDFLITPEEGSFIAWKKTTKGVVKLLITEDAKRTNPLVSRKCRASKVKVLEGFPGAVGTHYRGLVYETGVVLEVPDFDDDIRVECTKGIHFFMTKKEAEEW